MAFVGIKRFTYLLTYFLVSPPFIGPVCLISQGRFEEPVCPCS